MCETCGQCNPSVHDHGHSHAPATVRVERPILHHNDRLAAANRELLKKAGLLTLNLMSSPGSGKTTLLERTILDLKSRLSIGVIEGDQETSRDADRIRGAGGTAHQINTFDACHLDAHMIAHALTRIPLQGLDVLFLENVGNLVCPSAFDLGEDFRVVILSTTEGEDKAIKYPTMLARADLVLINKVDLLHVLEFDLRQCVDFVVRVHRNPPIVVSAKTGEGMDAWYRWIEDRIRLKRGPEQVGHPDLDPTRR